MALALLALLAYPAAAQTGSITVTIDCGNPESITVENNTDETLVLETLNSSENQTSENEIDLDDTEVAAGDSETVTFGSEGGGGNIFNNDLTETATVTISDDDYELTCEMGGTTTETFPVGTPATATPEATPEATAVATAGPGPQPTEGKPDTRQDEDGQTEDDQSEDMPEEMPETGVGGLATGLPVGSIAGGVSLLLLSGYALLRRR